MNMKNIVGDGVVCECLEANKLLVGFTKQAYNSIQSFISDNSVRTQY